MPTLRSFRGKTSEPISDASADAGFCAGFQPARFALPSLLAGAFAIGFAPIFVRLSELGPTATAFHRLLLALPALWLWNVLSARNGDAAARPSSRSDYVGLAAAGVFFAGDLACWHWSINFTSVANATLLANFAPVFVALAGFAFFGERFSRMFIIGMATALAGACVLMGRSFTLSPINLLGDALGLVMAAFYAGYIVSVGRLRAKFSTATNHGVERPGDLSDLVSGGARVWRRSRSDDPFRLGRAHRPRSPFPCRRTKPDRLCTCSPVRGILLGQPVAAAGGGGRSRMGHPRRGVGLLPGAGSANDSRRHLFRPPWQPRCGADRKGVGGLEASASRTPADHISKGSSG